MSVNTNELKANAGKLVFIGFVILLGAYFLYSIVGGFASALRENTTTKTQVEGSRVPVSSSRM